MSNSDFTCPQCGHYEKRPQESVGHSESCPVCGEIVPASATLSLPTDAEVNQIPPFPVQAESPVTPVSLATPSNAPAFQVSQSTHSPHRGTLLLILSLMSFLLGCVGLALGPVLFFMAKKDLREIGDGRMDPAGKGLTTFGFIAGIITTITGLMATVFVGLFVLALFLPAVSSGRDVARNMASANNLKMIGLGILTYHTEYNEFPVGESAVIQYESGKPLLSWRVHILPFIGEEFLYSQFHLDEPWDSPHNMALLELMPDIYKRPGYESATQTVYVAPLSVRGVLDSGQRIRHRDIVDGESQTGMVVELPETMAVPWTQPGATVVDLHTLHLFSPNFLPHVNVLFVDGSVNPISADLDSQEWDSLFDRSDGRTVFWE
ncbi:MAG: DUF1559 domain-containing protein [Planctomycetota bacterium]|nr:DUF1559 domain-containing protein [Planctomycetota bacterium]